MYETKQKALEWLSDFVDRVNTQNNRSTASPYIFCVQSLEHVFWAPLQMSAILVEKCDDGDGYNHYNYKDCAWFFTEEGAKQHLDLNAHNYNQPRTFVKHCFRSPEIERLLESVAEVVGKEYRKR